MGLRRVAHLFTCFALIGGSVSFLQPLQAEEAVSGQSRLATYETPAGDSYFALAVQPSADQELLDAVRNSPGHVVVVVDTSASQVGDFRQASFAALQSLLRQLRPEDRVKIFAADVQASSLSDSFAEGEGETSQRAVEKLRSRLPLGNTNLSRTLHAARAELTGAPTESRSIVYIGDGASLGDIRDQERFAMLIDALRADKIAIHSIAIGPTTDVALLATLANQTGGMVSLVASEKLEAAPSLAAQVADAAITAPVWIDSIELPEAMSTVQRDRLPPLRLDRDSVLVGRLQGVPEGTIRLSGSAPGSHVSISMAAHAEKSHPDFAFLPGLVDEASRDGGLTMPTPGSDALRAAARVLAHRADALAEEGALALKQGNRRGAKAVADMALQADPKNPEALAVARLASDEETLARLLQDDAAGPVGGAGVDLDLSAPIEDGREVSSGLLGRVQEERRLYTGQLRAEVNAALKQARMQLQRDPVGVTESLKVLLATVETEPDVDPEVRDELVRRVRAAIQAASAREAAYVEDQATVQQRQAAAEATERLLQETFRQEARIEQLSRQMNSLMEEGRYDEAAAEVAPEIVDLVGVNTVYGVQPKEYAELVSTVERQEFYRRMRERNFVDAFGLVEKAFVPFIDEPPIVYPDAETWQRLSRRRIERYGSLDLAGDNETERRIYAELDEETNMQPLFEETLQQAIRMISEEHEIPMRVDVRALEEVGLTADTPVTIDIQGISLRSYLRLLLEDVDLTYMIQDEVLKITTIEAAEANLVNKVYPVGDLVVPVISMGGMGGMMGGMGGGMGGMGGGMGGMGGGMGGMGGGMGGMGGGMMGGMGGMMVVPDDLSLADKAQSQPPTKKAPSQAAVTAGPLRVTPEEGQTGQQAWQAYFDSLEFASAEAQQQHDRRVRDTVRMLNVKAKGATAEGDKELAVQHFSEIRNIVSAALTSGQVQPWMYQAYALALMGSNGPQAEIERALLSAVDFSDTSAEVLHVARHLENIGSKAAALQLCQDVARAEPFGREAYLIGLRLAEDLDDLDGLRWACTGLLGQAWPEEQADFEDDVKRLARATYRRLQEDGRYEEAERFEKDVSQALAHDVVVRVIWTGEADIDLAVEEPSGTVCSLQNARSPGGGVLLGDAVPGDSKSGNVVETYVCPKGFSGTYRLLVRRIWGNVSTGQVTVQILTDIGRPSQRLIQQQIELKEQDALVLFEVKEGRRQEQVAAAQLEHLQEQKAKMGGAVLAQLANGSDQDTAADYIADLRRYRPGALGPAFGPRGFRGGGAVGFEPEITTLPEGASLTALGIISADRRYVRITPTPTFSQVGNVSTFNFVSGDTGNAGGGAGAGGGGIGGGVGGGGGFGGGGGGGIL